MSLEFDPYREWLDIPATERPPNYYDLLGLAARESDEKKIEDAAQRRISRVRSFQLGPHRHEALRLIGELSRAFACLQDPQRRQVYDQQLAGPGGVAQGPPPLAPPAVNQAAAIAVARPPTPSVAPRSKDELASTVHASSGDSHAQDGSTDSSIDLVRKARRTKIVVLLGIGMTLCVATLASYTNRATPEPAHPKVRQPSAVAKDRETAVDRPVWSVGKDVEWHGELTGIVGWRSERPELHLLFEAKETPGQPTQFEAFTSHLELVSALAEYESLNENVDRAEQVVVRGVVIASGAAFQRLAPAQVPLVRLASIQKRDQPDTLVNADDSVAETRAPDKNYEKLSGLRIIGASAEITASGGNDLGRNDKNVIRGTFEVQGRTIEVIFPFANEAPAIPPSTTEPWLHLTVAYRGQNVPVTLSGRTIQRPVWEGVVRGSVSQEKVAVEHDVVEEPKSERPIESPTFESDLAAAETKWTGVREQPQLFVGKTLRLACRWAPTAAGNTENMWRHLNIRFRVARQTVDAWPNETLTNLLDLLEPDEPLEIEVVVTGGRRRLPKAELVSIGRWGQPETRVKLDYVTAPLLEKPILSVRCHVAAAVNALSWSPDGSHLASGSSQGEVKILDPDDLSPLHEYKHQMRRPVGALRWSSTSNHLVSGEGWSLLMVDMTSLQALPWVGSGVKALDFNASGDTLVVAAVAKSVSMQSINFGRRGPAGNAAPFRILTNGLRDITGVAHDASGKMIAVGGTLTKGSFVLRVGQLNRSGSSYNKLADYILPERPTSLSWHGSSLSVESNSQLVIYQTDDEKFPEPVVLLLKPAMQRTIHLSFDGKQGAIRTPIHISVYDLATGAELHGATSDDLRLDQISCLAWSASGDQLALGDSTGKVVVCRADLSPALTLECDTGVSAVAWHPKGGKMATGHTAGTIKLWDFEPKEKVDPEE